MKMVMKEVSPDVLSWRRRTGGDRWDEMWEGVLHMTPIPTGGHQDIVAELWGWLKQHWALPTGGRVHLQRNVAEAGTWSDNYRVPDLVLVTPARFHLDKDLYIDGGPDVVVEVRSPDDETYEKLPFYAKIGVREAWVIDRDTKRPEFYEPHQGEMQAKQAGFDGWLKSEVTGVEMREADGKLQIRMAGRPETAAQLP